MAGIVGMLATSHVPLIGKAIASGLRREPYWRRFFQNYAPVHEWLAQVKPDVAVVFYNDHGLKFFLDKLPTFAIGTAREYRNADEGWGLAPFRAFPGDPDLSWYLIQSLVSDEFDMTTCQELLVDHAFAVPMALLWPNAERWPVKTVPISINTIQHPLPSASRCYALGRSVENAIRAYPEDLKVLIPGTGGLSHQLEGPRGFHQQRVRPHVPREARGLAGRYHALFDCRSHGGGRITGCRNSDVARGARGIARSSASGAQELSHSHFKHGRGAPALGAPVSGSSCRLRSA